MKFTLSGYYKPTPKKIKKIADSIVAGCATAATYISLNGDPKIGTIIFIVGVVAKIVSGFFTEEPKSND